MIKRLAHLTDIHLDEDDARHHGVDARGNWRILLQDVEARGIEKIIFGGDIGESSAHEWFFESLRRFELDLVLGNHDRCGEVGRFFRPPEQPNPDELYYGYDDDHFRYLFLDSSSGAISDPQLGWLEQQLETSRSLVLFVHHPILAVDAVVDRKYPLEGRGKVAGLLQRQGRRANVFCGHYHLADDRTLGSIEQSVTPAGCFQIAREEDPLAVDPTCFGYRILTLREDRITSQVVTL
ncbi:MAG: metallophosphoesterase family protein [Acidobacteriota bacterium]